MQVKKSKQSSLCNIAPIIADYDHLKLQFEFLGLFVLEKSFSGRKVTLSGESTLANVHTIEALLATILVSDQL